MQKMLSKRADIYTTPPNQATQGNNAAPQQTGNATPQQTGNAATQIVAIPPLALFGDHETPENQGTQQINHPPQHGNAQGYQILAQNFQFTTPTNDHIPNNTPGAPQANQDGHGIVPTNLFPNEEPIPNDDADENGAAINHAHLFGDN